MALISPPDREIIRRWAENFQSEVYLHLARGQGRAGEILARFCDEFLKLVPRAQIRRPPDEPFRIPAILTGRHENIAYQAVPLNKELQPFLDALYASVQSTAASEGRIFLPAELSVFIAPQCPHCPFVVRDLLSVAHENPSVRLTVIDGVLFKEQAEARDIRSVPTLILDNELRWTGRVDMEEVVEQCIRRDPARMSAASLRRMLEEGEADRLAAMMRENGSIFPALIDLLVHERWPVRLGAMVTVEYLAQDSPELAANLLEPLRKRFDDLDAQVQGDVVEVLAQIKSEAARAWLEKIAGGDYTSPVREAAAEGLEKRVKD